MVGSTDSGLKAYIRPHNREMTMFGMERGWGNGYIIIPAKHPAYKLATLQSKDQQYYYYQPEHFDQEITLTEFEKGGMIIGFDTMHSWNGPHHDKVWVTEQTLEMLRLVNAVDNRSMIKQKLYKLEELHHEIGELIKELKKEI